MKLLQGVKNNVLYTAIQFVLPLLTMAWLAQHLGATGYGNLSWIEFSCRLTVLVAALGIPYFGSKSLAQYEDLNIRNRLFSALLGIQLYALVFVSIIGVVWFGCSNLHSTQTVTLIWAWVYVVCQAFTLEWYFQGIQQYQFVIIRTLIIRLLGLLGTVLLVTKTSDVITGFIILVLTQFVIALVTVFHIRDQIQFHVLLKPQLTQQQRQGLFWLGLSTLCITGYTTLDTVMLGWLSNPMETGNYSLAVRFAKLPMIMLGAMITVFLIQGASLVKKLDMRAFQLLVTKSFQWLWILALPAVIFLYTCADVWLSILGGHTFTNGPNLLRILVWILPLMVISNVSGIQVLLALNRERNFFVVVLCALVISVLGYLAFIPKYGSAGAAWVTLFTEFCVALGCGYYARSWIWSRSLILFLFTWALAMAPLFFLLNGLYFPLFSGIVQLIVKGCLIVGYTVLLLVFFFNEYRFFESIETHAHDETI